VPLGKPLGGLFGLELHVVVAGAYLDLDGLRLGGVGIGLYFTALFLLFVLEFTIFHYFCNRRGGVGAYFDKVEPDVLGALESLAQGEYAEVLAPRPYNAHLRRPYLMVDSLQGGLFRTVYHTGVQLASMTIQEFYAGAAEAVKDVDAFARKHDLKDMAEADHICYKCGSTERFEQMRRMLEGESEYIHQAIISGRRIAYIRLKKSISTALGEITFLELSDQKQDGSQRDGFDHVEMFPVGISYDDLAAKLEGGGEVLKKVVRPHHTTYDLTLESGFLIRLEPDALIEKIKREEM
jgi:hypothetical protein